MSEYGTCECYTCYRRIPKPEAHRITIERIRGRSSGNFRISRRSTSFYTGRTYYKEQDVWLCDACYSAYLSKKRRQNRQLGIGAAFVFGLFAIFGAFNEKGSIGTEYYPEQSQTVSSFSSTPSPTQTADAVRTINPMAPPAPGDVRKAQNRLIELGFLIGPADGVWGNRSRMALRAFKGANDLPSDDKWDDLVNNRIYSAAAARAPLPLATTGR